MALGRGGKDVVPDAHAGVTPGEERPGMYRSDVEEMRRSFGGLGADVTDLRALVAEVVKGLAGVKAADGRTGDLTSRVAEVVAQLVERTEQLTTRVEGAAGRLDGLEASLVAKVTEAVLRAKPAAQGEQGGKARSAEIIEQVVAQLGGKIGDATNSIVATNADLGATVDARIGRLEASLGEAVRLLREAAAAQPAAAAPAQPTAQAPAPAPTSPAPKPRETARLVDEAVERLGKQIKERGTTPKGRRLFTAGRVRFAEMAAPGTRIQADKLGDVLKEAMEEVEAQKLSGAPGLVVVCDEAEALLATRRDLVEEATRRRVYLVSARTLETFVRCANAGGGGSSGPAGQTAPANQNGPELGRAYDLIVAAGSELRSLTGSEGIRAKLVEAADVVKRLKGGGKESKGDGAKVAPAQAQTPQGERAAQQQSRPQPAAGERRDAPRPEPPAASAPEPPSTNGAAGKSGGARDDGQVSAQPPQQQQPSAGDERPAERPAAPAPPQQASPRRDESSGGQTAGGSGAGGVGGATNREAEEGDAAEGGPQSLSAMKGRAPGPGDEGRLGRRAWTPAGAEVAPTA